MYTNYKQWICNAMMIRLHVLHSDWRDEIYALSAAFSNIIISESDLDLWKMTLIQLVTCKETIYAAGYDSLDSNIIFICFFETFTRKE
jgi:hypothetical protein